jgi:sensor c-di-GMP phosphodiesterase-like protein
LRFSRKYLLATLAGVLLAGLPMAIFNFWLDELVERQGHEEVLVSARRIVTLAEARLTRVTQGLQRLAERGVDSCRPSHIEALRRERFEAIPIKELSVLGPGGQTLCTDLGIALGPRKVISSQTILNGEFLLEVVTVGEPPKRMIRVIRPVSGSNGLAALVPAELFLPQVSTQGGPFNAYARMLLRDGTVVGENGAPPGGSANGAAPFGRTIRLERFGLAAELYLRRGHVTESQVDLNKLGLVITGGIALVIWAFAALVPWRQRGNPVAQIAQAIEAGEFVPFYQPIVDIISGRLLGAEVLVRWRKEDGSFVGPGQFIPLVESSGLIIEMTRALMRAACAEIGEAVRERPDFKVSFNLTARHFADERVIDDIRDIFGRSPMRLTQVVVEVTERQPLANLTTARRVIAALQGIGVRVAIDDVGTGHSGLSYLLKLGVDIIKVDKMFVDAVSTERNSATIVESLVDLARNMRMEIVAEGVENFDQVISLREHGIRAAQGYVFAPPLSGSSFLRLLAAMDSTANNAAAGAGTPPLTRPLGPRLSAA